MRALPIIMSFFLLGFLPGCDSDSSNSEAKSTAKDGVSSAKTLKSFSDTLFEREMTKRSCDFLSTEDVAAVAGVDSSALTQRAMSSMCLYSWDGGQASLTNLRTSKTVESARDRFENSYKSQTGEEVAQHMAKIDTGIKKQEAEGKTDVDSQKASQVTDTVSGVFSGGLQYEDIPGLGDIARFETTRIESKLGGKTLVSYSNALNVLTKNLKFTVSFNRDGGPKLHRDEAIALAEAVLGKLSG